ncbi:MAG: DUF106 domain-containing protein [Candidatus Woesearchaeota archaeon]|nr:MAG: DUF106 domain-containing protein [Candidatus Woesearchaeota archaeon]
MVKEIMIQYPFWSILLIAVGLSLIVTLAYKYLTDQTLMKELKKELKKNQKRLKEARGEPDKMMAIQKETMHTNMKYMSQSMKPMIFTIIPFLIIFAWLRSIFEGTVVIPLSFHVPLSSLETGMGWIGTYIILSMIFTTIFRRVLKIA